jgi:Mg-chelatase subunit ChlI
MGIFMTVPEHRSKIRDMYTFISERLYFNRPDLAVQGESANATVLLSLLTALIGGTALIIGEPGLGKTTAAEYICSLLYCLPLGVIWSGEVSGHPEQTEEKNRWTTKPGETQPGRRGCGLEHVCAPARENCR